MIDTCTTSFVAELPGIDVLLSREVTRDIHEGRLHDGRSAVVQFIATSPKLSAS
jgi:hypothetical protein